jgi:DNA-binding HxlR family transcriptional regulator
MKNTYTECPILSQAECNKGMLAIDDALYAIGGKWKLRIILALRYGKKRFNELQRTVPGISARVLSNELKELELNGFVRRNVFPQSPVLVEYEATEYSLSLNEIIKALSDWGGQHKHKVKREMQKAVEMS